MLVDSHCHLDSINDLKNVILKAKQNGINKIITVGTSIKSSKENVEIARQYSTDDFKIYAACGIHPKDGKDDTERFSLYQCIEMLKRIAGLSKKAVGVGEAGLDYRLTSDPSTSSGQLRQLTTDEEKGLQRELFEAQIKLAAELNLPLVIHCRNAWEDIFSLLTTDYSPQTKLRGVFHSWTGDWNMAKKALDLGFYISFSGIVTFKNAKDIQEVARKMPFDRMLIETDSPFLTPEPLRSGGPPKLTTRLSSSIRTRLVERNRRVYKINEPKNVKIVARFIADLRGLSLDKITEITSRNAEELFRLNKKIN